MVKKTARKSRGRPRSHDRSALTLAQIRRADAQARRTARHCTDLERSHVPIGDVADDWRATRVLVEGEVRRLPAELAPAVLAAAAAGPGAVSAAVLAGIDGALRRLAAQAPANPKPLRTRRLAASRSLAAARARAATWHATRITLTEQIATGDRIAATRVREVSSDAAIVLKGRLRAIPTNLAPTLTACAADGAPSVVACLAAPIERALAELPDRLVP